MNWEAIGAVGELLSAVAVLVTLIYLAVQVKNARVEMQQSILQYRDQGLQNLMLEGNRNSTLTSAYVKASKMYGAPPVVEAVLDASDLTPEEAHAYSQYQIAWWFYRAETVRNISELSESQRDDFDSNIFFSYSRGLGKVWFDEWKTGRGVGDPTIEYCSHVLEVRSGT
jgi:hypothetical protein